jgi:hypothetical protein
VVASAYLLREFRIMSLVEEAGIKSVVDRDNFLRERPGERDHILFHLARNRHDRIGTPQVEGNKQFMIQTVIPLECLRDREPLRAMHNKNRFGGAHQRDGEFEVDQEVQGVGFRRP